MREKTSLSFITLTSAWGLCLSQAHFHLPSGILGAMTHTISSPLLSPPFWKEIERGNLCSREGGLLTTELHLCKGQTRDKFVWKLWDNTKYKTMRSINWVRIAPVCGLRFCVHWGDRNFCFNSVNAKTRRLWQKRCATKQRGFTDSPSIKLKSSISQKYYSRFNPRYSWGEVALIPVDYSESKLRPMRWLKDTNLKTKRVPETNGFKKSTKLIIL